LDRTFTLAALAAALTLSTLAGCELMKPNLEAQAAINQRVVGMPVGDFQQQFGRFRTRTEQPDGTTTYNWESAIGRTPAGQVGPDDHICKLFLTANAGGRIDTALILLDAQGNKSNSRCREIFAAGA
jgi:hypothetical protein